MAQVKITNKAAEDTKEKAAEKTEEKKETKEPELEDLEKSWLCSKCSMFNKSESWTCTACYRARFTGAKNKKKRPQFKIPSKMKGLIKKKGSGGYEYEERDVPTPGDDELLVRSYATGICGSDLILYKWTKDASTIAKTPFVPGHETAGLVVLAGKNCKINVGQRVAIENHFFCGECFQCKDGRNDICANLNQFGHGKGTTQGGLSQYFIVKEQYCYRLRSSISWRDAALLEPLGVAFNAVERVGVRDTKSKNETAMVIGCGTIGLLAIGVLKAKGVKRIIAIDIVKQKLDVAKQMGATDTINAVTDKDPGATIMKLTDNVGIGRLIECSGNEKMIVSAFSWLRKGGNIVLVGLPKAPLVFQNAMTDIVFKSLTLRTIHGRRIFETWKQTEDLIRTRRINTDLIMSKKYDMVPLSKYNEVFKAFETGSEMKIVFDPQK